MGNQFCEQCKTYESNPNYITNLADLSDPDAPDPNYAFPENITYDIPCEVNHIYSDLLPIGTLNTIQNSLRILFLAVSLTKPTF